MLTMVAKLKVQPGKEAEFERAGREMVAFVKSHEPETVTYVFHRAAKDPRTFLFFERYTGKPALDAHQQSSQMAKLLEVVGPILDGAPEIERYEELEGKL
jgi:quinol monooxygenase YgiN